MSWAAFALGLLLGYVLGGIAIAAILMGALISAERTDTDRRRKSHYADYR